VRKNIVAKYLIFSKNASKHSAALPNVFDRDHAMVLVKFNENFDSGCRLAEFLFGGLDGRYKSIYEKPGQPENRLSNLFFVARYAAGSSHSDSGFLSN